MSRENVKLARRSLDAFARGDLKAALDAADPGIVAARVHPDAAVFHGHDGLLRMVSDWAEGFSEWSYINEEFIDAGDHVVVRQRQRGVGAESGVPVEDDYWLVYTFEDGKIVRFEVYADREQALSSAGLPDGSARGS